MVQLDRDPPYRWPDLCIRNSVLQSTMYLIIALPYCSPYQPIGSLPLNSGEFQQELLHSVWTHGSEYNWYKYPN